MLRLYLLLYSIVWRLRGREVVHFLHIGKTGGTAIKAALAAAPVTRYRILLHPHGVVLADLPRGDRVVFCLRDPVNRFVSGFFSRQRQGRPRYDSPWSPAEEEAFTRFSSPLVLGEALSAEDSGIRAAAEAAMRGIAHVRDSYWSWLGSEAQLLSRRKDILFVGFQESLHTDFLRLARLLDSPGVLPADDISAHRNPESADRRLSVLARTNLERWYCRDYDCIALCRREFGTGSES
jgi:hypothetical protein